MRVCDLVSCEVLAEVCCALQLVDMLMFVENNGSDCVITGTEVGEGLDRHIYKKEISV